MASELSISTIIAISAAECLVVEGGDASYAYPFGFMDIPILMEQATYSSKSLEKPENVCLVQRYMCGKRQARKIWGSIVVEILMTWYGLLSAHEQVQVEPWLKRWLRMAGLSRPLQTRVYM